MVLCSMDMCEFEKKLALFGEAHGRALFAARAAAIQEKKRAQKYIDDARKQNEKKQKIVINEYANNLEREYRYLKENLSKQETIEPEIPKQETIEPEIPKQEIVEPEIPKAKKVYETWGGNLSEHEQPFVKLGVEYSENFYTYVLDTKSKTK